MAFIVLSLVLVGAVLISVWARRRESRAELAGHVRKLAGAVAAACLVFMLMCTITVVPAGHVGVINVFGRVSPTTLPAGIQFVNPMARVIEMSVQTQEIKETMDVPSKEGMTMMCVTHEMGFARKVAHRVIFMDEGRIVEDAPTEAFFASPRSERARAFLSKILHH